MRPAVLLLATLAVALTGAGQSKVIRLGKLWDGAAVLHNVEVVVENGKIATVGKAGGKRPAGAEVIDLRRYSGVPGLIDVHTHITYYWDRRPGTEPRAASRGRHAAVTVFLAQENARRTLETGVTTVRDLNAGGGLDFAMRELIALGKMTGPRILAAGQGIGGRPKPPGPEEMRRLVGERIKAGADWIKLFASTGGFHDVSGTQTLSYEEMAAAVEATRAAGKRIAIHTYGPTGFRDAVRAGPDSIEHGADVDDETLREMARKGVYFVPTIDHNRYYLDAREEYAFPQGAEVALRDYLQRNLDTARRAHAAGVKFALGSDAVYSMFGQNTRELEWFVKAGLSPAQALQAATVNGAELLGLAATLGKVAPGYAADLVAVAGEPWQDISAVIRGVKWVMKDGAVVVDKR
jgi:imidazolonepropionase-like amidohydrolase